MDPHQARAPPPHPRANAGPPHYAPREVRLAARRVLDALFPLGRRSRQVVRLAFWLLNPLSGLLLLPVRFNTWLVGLVGSLLAWALRAADRLLLRRGSAAAAKPGVAGAGARRR